MSYYALLYTDPGSGTLILQLLAAGLFGLLFYLRYFIRRVKGFFLKRDELAREAKVPEALDSTVKSSQSLPETESEMR
jgi:hypothetical protein